MIDAVVLSNTSLTTIEQWQGAIDTTGFDISIETPIPLESLDGFVTVTWNTPLYDGRDKSEFKCRYFNIEQAREIDGIESHIDSFETFLVLGWSGDAVDRVALQIAAAAYAVAVDGNVYLPELGQFTPTKIIEDIKSDDRYKSIPRRDGTRKPPKYNSGDLYRYDQRPRTKLTNSPSTNLRDLKSSGYAILVGRNNSGKSFALKALTAHWGNEASYLGPARYQNFNLLPIFTPTEKKENKKWTHFSNEWKNQTLNSDNSPLGLQQAIAELSNEQRTTLKNIVKLLLGAELEFRFTDAENEMSQKYVSCNGHNISFASSGTRLIVTLITSLLDDNQHIVLVDEPELGISPEAQGILADFFGDEKLRKEHFPHIKTLVLATHSTIFLDRKNISNNYIVEKGGDEISIRRITSQQDFNNVHFWLLGNRFETLYLPASILLVEGKSDHKFIERVVSLRYPNSRLSIIPTNSDSQIKHHLHMAKSLLNDIQRSPYHNRIFVILDSVHSRGLPDDIVRMGIPKDNIIRWSVNGIEYVYPDSLLDQVFGKGPPIRIENDVVSRNGVSLGKAELAERIAAILRPDTPMHEEFSERLLSKLDKLLK